MLTWPSGCCCRVAVTVTFRGCGSRALSGLAYTIYDPNGNVVTSGTTGSTGQATFTATIPGIYTYDASKTRFNTVTGATLATYSAPCPSTDSIFKTMAAASGFICNAHCADPIKTTLQLTDAVYGGPFTLTWNGLGWVATVGVSYGGQSGCGCGCASVANYQVNYSLDAGSFIVSASGLAAGGCPSVGFGTTTLLGSLSMTLTSCPPTFNLTRSGTGLNCYYCGGFSYTVTE